MMNRLRKGDLGVLKAKAVLTNTGNREEKVKKKKSAITFVFVLFVVTTSQLTTNISKKPLPVVLTGVQLVTKT